MVEIVKKDIRFDSNKREYALLKLKKVYSEVEGKNIISNKTCYYKALKNSYLDNNPEFGYNANVGDLLEGTIVTRKVKPYNIGTRIVFTFTCFIPTSEEDEVFELMVHKYFENQGKELLDEVDLMESIIDEE